MQPSCEPAASRDRRRGDGGQVTQMTGIARRVGVPAVTIGAVSDCRGRDSAAPPPTCRQRSTLGVCAGRAIAQATSLDLATFRGAIDRRAVEVAGSDSVG